MGDEEAVPNWWGFQDAVLNLRKFPFDMQKISFIIKAEAFRTHPIFKSAPNLKRTTHWGDDDSLAIFCDECSLQQYRIIAKDAGAQNRHQFWKDSTKMRQSRNQASNNPNCNPSLESSGDMTSPNNKGEPEVDLPLGHNPSQPSPHSSKAERSDKYVVDIFVERLKRSHHWYSLIMIFILTILCISCTYDVASATVSSRLSICLLIILALAEYTSKRPAPIEKSARMTFWDWVLFVMFAFLALLVFTNTVSVTMCAGFHGEAPAYLIEMHEDYKDVCDVGWCYSRRIDCSILAVFFTLFFILLGVMYVYGSISANERQALADAIQSGS